MLTFRKNARYETHDEAKPQEEREVWIFLKEKGKPKNHPQAKSSTGKTFLKEKPNDNTRAAQKHS